ncbi:citrulline utilization hydrolase CtlX [Pseudofulvibacter geojedonensis]|uniref:Citrulline utilization hydrolase CtlX n=1 Tax=Pseudofulvibacter geojedonensis TaxID=1123758 RepID=A0ABW3I4X9_9FLAO
MNKQTTNTVLMVRPVAFVKNEQTAISNHFQQDILSTPNAIQEKALKEFNGFVKALKDVGVKVLVIEDTKEPHTPDSIFPNNWISFHEGGTVAVYPMEAVNRRDERREEVLELVEENGLQINNVIDYTEAEEEGVFLEGTGSMVLDRQYKKAYCALSSRADEDLFVEFCEDFDYDPVIFRANQTVKGNRKPIYHTNVMLCIGEKFAVICLDAIDDKKEKKNVLQHLKQTNKDIIAITEEQMHSFAGNMLELKGNNKQILVMSTQARESLKTEQLVKLEKYCYLLTVNISTIETLGGGSARCMLAEVF